MPSRSDEREQPRDRAGGRQGGARRSRPRARKAEAASNEERDGVRKKKSRAVINRRGPSELDRAIEMASRMAASRAAASPKNGAKRASAGGAARGTIIRIDRSKGYGFLVDAAGEQRFFHRSAVLNGGFGELKVQQAVEFEPHNDQRGARALKVRPAVSPAPSNRSQQTGTSSPKSAGASSWRSDLSPFRSGTSVPNADRKRL